MKNKKISPEDNLIKHMVFRVEKTERHNLKISKKIPLILPKGTIIDDEDYSGFEFGCRLINYEGINKPYLMFAYWNPNEDEEEKPYIFKSKYDCGELIEYLKQFNLFDK